MKILLWCLVSGQSVITSRFQYYQPVERHNTTVIGMWDGRGFLPHDGQKPEIKKDIMSQE